ncbi:MAG: hypothetical protein LC624_01715 [Halobacteriales archaeon]|nr:hypothetical protein [Halobacteriales archaeon]
MRLVLAAALLLLLAAMPLAAADLPCDPVTPHCEARDALSAAVCFAQRFLPMRACASG